MAGHVLPYIHGLSGGLMSCKEYIEALSQAPPIACGVDLGDRAEVAPTAPHRRRSCHRDAHDEKESPVERHLFV